MASRSGKLPAGALEICKSFDKNNDGFITKKEIRQSFEKSEMSNAEIDELLKVADVNHDGKINYQEFFAAISKK